MTSTVVKKPNIKGPRFRDKHIYSLSKELFKQFTEKYPQYIDVDYKIFNKVIKKDNENIWKSIVELRDGVKLREGLGNIIIVGCNPSKREVIDYKRSEEAGHKVLHKNWECDNHLAKIIYTNYGTKYKFRNRELWSFFAVRQFKRAGSKEFRKDYKKFVHLASGVKASRLFSNKPYIDFVIPVKEIDLTNYDEFNFD